MLAGEKLIADVYNALRQSAQWLESLLLIVWDEHGGFYDHIEPPRTINPDGKVAEGCDFNLLGVRVPAVVVSPWVPRNTVDSTVYDHTSIPATLKAVFGTREFLTARDAHASTFDKACSLDTPRGDAPSALSPARASIIDSVHAAAQRVRAQFRSPTDLQRSLVQTANAINPEAARRAEDIQTEWKAASHTHQALQRFLLS